jgi:hypothetical protein
MLFLVLLFTTGPHALKSRTFSIPADIRPLLCNTALESVTFQYTDPIHALVSMLHFNPLAADWDNLALEYEESNVYDDYCNGDRMQRIQATLDPGSAQLNAVMYFDGIQQDATGFQSVDGGIIMGGFFRKAAREQNEAMRSICSFVQVLSCTVSFFFSTCSFVVEGTSVRESFSPLLRSRTYRKVVSCTTMSVSRR